MSNFKNQLKVAFSKPGTWIAISSLLGAAFVDLIPGFDLGAFESYVKMFLVVLASLGVVSNPKDGKWFIDKDGNGIDDREEDWYKEEQKNKGS